MDNMVIVLVVVAVVAVVFVGLIVLIPYLVKKGINVSGVLTGTTTVLDTSGGRRRRRKPPNSFIKQAKLKRDSGRKRQQNLSISSSKRQELKSTTI